MSVRIPTQADYDAYAGGRYASSNTYDLRRAKAHASLARITLEEYELGLDRLLEKRA